MSALKYTILIGLCAVFIGMLAADMVPEKKVYMEPQQLDDFILLEQKDGTRHVTSDLLYDVHCLSDFIEFECLDSAVNDSTRTLKEVKIKAKL